jgi:L-rhamnose mutarotase
MRRVASVIGLQPGAWTEYEALHADVWPAVLEQIARSGIHNYSIHRWGDVLFSYFEYVGDDYEADMAAMAADAATQRWWSVCNPLQSPVSNRTDGEWWHELREVFHTD